MEHYLLRHLLMSRPSSKLQPAVAAAQTTVWDTPVTDAPELAALRGRVVVTPQLRAAATKLVARVAERVAAGEARFTVPHRPMSLRKYVR